MSFRLFYSKNSIGLQWTVCPFWRFLYLSEKTETVSLWLFVNFPDVGEFPSTAFKYAGWRGSFSVPLVKLLFGFLAPTLQGLWVIHNPRGDVIAFGCRAPRGESWRLYRIPIWGGTQEPKGFITFTSRACRGLWCVSFFHKQMPDFEREREKTSERERELGKIGEFLNFKLHQLQR